jgi:hypothetical protein
MAEVRATAAEPTAEPAGELMAAVLALPLRQRQVVACRLFLDLDTAQTAQTIGIAPGWGSCTPAVTVSNGVVAEAFRLPGGHGPGKSPVIWREPETCWRCPAPPGPCPARTPPASGRSAP